MRTVVLVEGESDRAAVLALGHELGLELGPERGAVDVVAMGGITNVGRHVSELVGTHRLLGLYDAGEERFVRRALEGAGLGMDGFHRCDRDLEDELIRALGTDRVLEVVEREGDLSRFHGLAQQPAQRDRSVADQLRRFLGSGSGRKIRYAALLVAALDPGELPAPLAALRESVRATIRP